MRWSSCLILALALFLAPSAAPADPPILQYRTIAAYPHDREAFTQGLFWLDGHLYESTGLEGRSTIRKVNLRDGKVLRSIALPANLFGEGIVNWGREIISITWRTGIGYRWDRATFGRLGEWRYPGEGWGLTQDGAHIIMSDGTSYLRFLDPRTLAEVRRVRVTSDGVPLHDLNELEYVEGAVFANVWRTNLIARIDPQSGHVTGWLDLTALADRALEDGRGDVLNGIAWDPRRRRMLVTGKNWPTLFEIALEHAD